MNQIPPVILNISSWKEIIYSGYASQGLELFTSLYLGVTLEHNCFGGKIVHAYEPHRSCMAPSLTKIALPQVIWWEIFLMSLSIIP